MQRNSAVVTGWNHSGPATLSAPSLGNSGAKSVVIVLDHPQSYPKRFVETIIEIVVGALKAYPMQVEAELDVPSDAPLNCCKWESAPGWGVRENRDYGTFDDVSIHSREELKQSLRELLLENEETGSGVFRLLKG